jgi:hypothetical protein
LISVVLVLGLLYVGDFLYFRVRMLHRTPTNPLESLKILRVLAIPEKNDKTEYEVDAQNPEQTITCVHSVFPHSGYSLVVRQAEDQPTDPNVIGPASIIPIR